MLLLEGMDDTEERTEGKWPTGRWKWREGRGREANGWQGMVGGWKKEKKKRKLHGKYNRVNCTQTTDDNEES